MTIIFTIVLISAIGIFLIYLLINNLLRKHFYIPHIPNSKKPSDFNLDYKEHFLKTESSKKIQLWDLNPSSNKTIVLAVHGWRNSADSLLPLISGIKDSAHFYVLNTRNHGGSDSEKELSISKYKEDIQTAIEFIISEADDKDIVLLGHSFGAATVLEMAHTDNSISGLILLSLFTDGEKLMRRQLNSKKIPKQFSESLVKYIEFKNGEKLSRVAPEEIIAAVKIPILMIHGYEDEAVSIEDFNKLKKQLNNDSKDVLVNNAAHVSVLDQEKVKTEIKSFIDSKFETQFIFSPAFLSKVD